jgi:hypothetical protein
MFTKFRIERGIMEKIEQVLSACYFFGKVEFFLDNS